MLPSSFLRPTFSMDLSIGDRVFYTRSNACDLLPRWLARVECGESAMQEGVHLVCHPPKFQFATSLPSIFTAQHTVKFPPKGPWSFTTATTTGKVPSRSPPGRFGLPNSKGVSKGSA